MVENQKIVTVIYDLFVHNADGSEDLMERATEEHPLTYYHGENMMLPMFEAHLAGKNEGDAFDFRIPCKEAYGEYDEQGVMTLEKTLFHNGDGVFDSERVFVGNVVPMNTSDGQIINAQIVNITDEHVTIDLNHPLAGEDLHFVGKILTVRDATPQELDALHHGHHCCGGCGDECGGDGCGHHDGHKHHCHEHHCHK